MAARTTTTANLGGGTHVILYGPQLAELLAGPGGPVFRHMQVVGKEIKREAVRIAPRVTGNLAAHIVTRNVIEHGEPNVLVGVENVPYAVWVIEGANPHPIDARRAPNLVFFWERVGRLFVGPHVDHPGNAPNNFLERAAAAVLDRSTGGTPP